MGLRLALPEQRKQKLQRVLVADAAFMAQELMMDYSLLVGVLTPQPEERAIGEGFRGVRGETYFLGVIDILECWKLRWRVQGAILKFFFRYVACSRWFNPEGITAIHPDDYAERFVEFFGIHVLGLPPAATPQGGKTWHPYW